MSIVSFLSAGRRRLARMASPPEVISELVYRDLVAAIYTMRAPIIGLGALYVIVGSLIVSVWPDPVITVLTISAIIVTTGRAFLIAAFYRSGGADQPPERLRVWERRYAGAAYVFALLLAALAVRCFAVSEPLIHMTVVSLIFTFGAGVVARTSGRPLIGAISIALAVGPTVAALVYQAFGASGRPLQFEFSLLEAALLAIVATMSLISARHTYRTMIDHLTAKHDFGLLARSDPLTGLPNRLLLREAFQPSVNRSASSGLALAVHYVDLDGFKAINDGYGHPAGDVVLREVARRLSESVRRGDTVSRLGGDEFIVVQAGIEHRGEAELLARRIIKKLSAPYFVQGREMRIAASIGTAMSPEFGTDLEYLIGCADTALYRSKANGKAQVQFFSESLVPQPALASA